MTALPPVAMALGVTSVNATGVTLVGAVDVYGQSGSYYFSWGSAQTLGNIAGSAAASATSSAQVVQAPLTGLVQGRTYYFAVFANSAGGSAESAVLSFTPTASPPATTPQTSNNVAIPHFAWPFKITNTGAVVVEQDTEDEIISCVNVIAHCFQGEWPQDPSFGIPDMAFSEVPLDIQGLEAAIIRWEPRASLDVILGAYEYPTGNWPVNITASEASQ